MDPPRLGESCRSVFPPDGRQQALLHANRAFGVFGRCWGPGGTRRSQIGPAERGDVEQDKEPSLKQVAPGEVPETGTTRMRETVLAEVAQRSPTSPETNLESRAMQVRVPWTQAWLCTKDFRRKCTGAGEACKVAVPSNAAQRGVASISPAESGCVVLARPCVKVLISRQASCRFLLWSRAALSLRGRASKFRSSRRRRVDQRRCAAFFLPRNKLCVEKFGARSVQEEE
ncbi:hypothetical protein NDU88_001473 [Pleurodeles waltl]|uniref:Uncharacterized protein n=1 Tax=Pleurodeles waltl TaxID=8319 RepID=A0AAV7V8E4_PLEWA|nr:hypothetical protein NDU88_001473 [Pleurodeles waltl]